jgi:hypothetical protein
MQLSEIPAEQWAGFLDQFSRAHHGQQADIDTVGPDDNAWPQARGVRLLGVTAEEAPGEGRRIDIIAADPAGPHVRRAVSRPARIRAAEWNDAVSAELRIDSEAGSTTRVRVGPQEQVLSPGMITDGFWRRD